MNLVSKFGLSTIVVGVLAAACSNSSEPEQGIVASNVQPNPQSQAGCNSPEQFIYLPENASIPGPDTNNNANIVVTGTGDDVINCSVIPSGSGYNVTLTAQITGGTAPGTLTIQGMFTPRGRDSTGNPNADGTTIPNITVDMLDATKHLNEKDCFAQYVEVNDGTPSTTSLPTQADVFADDHGGRIWASVFCDNPTNELESQKPGNAGCMMSATFRFENCASKAQ